LSAREKEAKNRMEQMRHGKFIVDLEPIATASVMITDQRLVVDEMTTYRQLSSRCVDFEFPMPSYQTISIWQ